MGGVGASNGAVVSKGLEGGVETSAGNKKKGREIIVFGWTYNEIAR